MVSYFSIHLTTVASQYKTLVREPEQQARAVTNHFHIRQPLILLLELYSTERWYSKKQLLCCCSTSSLKFLVRDTGRYSYISHEHSVYLHGILHSRKDHWSSRVYYCGNRLVGKLHMHRQSVQLHHRVTCRNTAYERHSLSSSRRPLQNWYQCRIPTTWTEL